MNIGIILHCPKNGRVFVQFLDYETRIKHFTTELQFAEFRAFRKMFAKHIKDLDSQMFDPLINVSLTEETYLEELQATLKMPFLIAKPEFIFIEEENISHHIKGLYQNLILTDDEIRIKRKPLMKQVEERLVSEGLERYLERDIKVRNLPFKLNIDFGYKHDNTMDLIQSISLQESPRENYKEGVFWKEAVLKLQSDNELNVGEFTAIVRPPSNAQKIGFSELIRQFDSIDHVTVVNYNTPEFERFIHVLKNPRGLERAL